MRVAFFVDDIVIQRVFDYHSVRFCKRLYFCPSSIDKRAERETSFMNRDDSFVLESQIGFVIRRVAQRHIAIFSSLIPDITPTQFVALAKLCEIGQASQNELGRLTSIDNATIKAVVGRLRGRGFVFAESLASDKRRLILTPTVRGKTLYRELTAKASDASQQTLSPLSNDERRHLMELLTRVGWKREEKT